MKDLIRDKLLSLTGRKRVGFFGILTQSSTEEVEITLPEYDYLRAEVFVADTKKLSEDPIVHRLNVPRLIIMLFEDFVEVVRYGTDLNLLIEDLALRKQRTEQRELKRVSTDHWTIREFDDREMLVNIILVIPRETLYRAQVLLRDLWEFNQNARWTVEGIITLLILDLVREVKRGNGNKFSQSIVFNLDHNA